MKQSLQEKYFDDVYRYSEDPWSYETSDYEKKKYAATISALPKPHYETALELGCSIGVLTNMLSKKCSALLSVDVSDLALQKAKERLKSKPHIRFEKMFLPNEYPAEKFDLVIMSEVGYYLSLEDLKIAKEKIVSSLHSNGDLILVHWLPFVHDYPLTGDEVHNFFAEKNAHLKHVYGSKEEKYRIDVYTKLID